jgi:hypothetical protein
MVSEGPPQQESSQYLPILATQKLQRCTRNGRISYSEHRDAKHLTHVHADSMPMFSACALDPFKRCESCSVKPPKRETMGMDKTIPGSIKRITQPKTERPTRPQR